MATMDEWAIPLAVLLFIMAAQLFWLGRIVRLSGRLVSGKRAGYVLEGGIGAVWLFYFVYNVGPWTSSAASPTSLSLRNILLDAPFSWWLVGSLAGFGIILVFWVVDHIARSATFLFHKAAARSPEPEPSSPTRRRFLEQSAMVFAVMPFVGAGYGLLYGRLRLEVTHRTIRLTRLPKQFDGFRIVHLSDIHIGPFLTGDQLRHFVGVANTLGADLVALTGDFLSYDRRAQREVVQILADLRAPHGVVGCLGNHEFLTGTEDSITKLFAEQGVQIFRQQATLIRSDDQALNLVGIDYQQERFSNDHDGHLVDRYMAGSENLFEPGIVNILLNHNPNAFERAAELGVDLMLAGHTHGGQVSLEFLHRGLTLARLETPYVSGWYQKGGSQLYVNRGIGTTGAPIRFGCPPEIAVLELRRSASAGVRGHV